MPVAVVHRAPLRHLPRDLGRPQDRRVVGGVRRDVADVVQVGAAPAGRNRRIRASSSSRRTAASASSTVAYAVDTSPEIDVDEILVRPVRQR
ncbi:hypothetical protein [Pseudonocardia sp. ICBG1034]|uniref:hypothetical protein n=1 Tax=Pseudonocardia sp. ICBG1034 TaxID=2844381 RepID=UPI001CCF6669|nr:hypothetical protein [Pseudonocardia sp. ICBG1034]